MCNNKGKNIELLVRAVSTVKLSEINTEGEGYGNRSASHPYSIKDNPRPMG